MAKSIRILKFLVLLVIVANVSIYNISATGVDSNEEPPKETKLIGDEKNELSDEAVGAIIKDFGQHISEMMATEMDKLMKEVESSKSSGHENEIEKLKDAKQSVTRDIKARIELAGENNESNLPQAGLGDVKNSMSSFFSRTSTKLQSAGSFIGQKMSSLGGLIKNVPGKLRRLMRWPSFLNFKIKHNKTYKSMREELYRQMVYLHTQAKVGIQNMRFMLRRQTFLLKATAFADTTPAEYHEKFNNEMAEGPMDTATNKLNDMSPSTKNKLKELAKSGKNIFNVEINSKLGDKRANEIDVDEHSGKRRRTKREADELDDDELFEDSQLDFGNVDDLDMDDDLSIQDGDIKSLDSYASLADSSAMNVDELNKINDIIDDALDADETFTPIDLRDTGCIGRPENQEGCGCCYAHAATSVAIYLNCMASKKESGQTPKRPDRYHARFTAECGRYLTDEGQPLQTRGCSGGRISGAVEFIRQAGANLFMDYEFARVSSGNYEGDSCPYPRPKALSGFGSIEVPFYKQAVFTNIKIDEVDLHLRTIGPVFINVRTWKNFKDYGAGIYDGYETSEDTTIHSMLIVGHDKDEKGRDYWIILNSHGTAWGENGFARIYTEPLMFFKHYMGGLVPNQNI